LFPFWLIAITSFPVVDIRVLLWTPNHVKRKVANPRHKHLSPHGRLVILSFSIVHRITSLAIGAFLLSCRQISREIVVDVEPAEVAEMVEAVEAVGAARVPQVMVTVAVAVVVVAAVAVVVATRLLSTELQPPEDYAIFIGPLEPAIAALTARSSMRQESWHPYSPQIIPPTFSR